MAKASRHNSRLRNCRIERGLTQSRLAELIGVDTRTVQRWETGLSTPRPYSLRKLCKCLDATPEDLGFFDPAAVEEATEKQAPVNQFQEQIRGENNYYVLLLILVGGLLLLLFFLLTRLG